MLRSGLFAALLPRIACLIASLVASAQPAGMGLILDSSVVIDAERRGETVERLLYMALSSSSSAWR